MPFRSRPLRRTLVPAEKPLRDELLSIELLEERAKSLAARFTVGPCATCEASSPLRDNARLAVGLRRWPTMSITDGSSRLPPSGFSITSISSRPKSAPFVRICRPLLSPAADAPQRQCAGHARVYAMALELMRHSDSRLDRSQLAALHEQLSVGGAADDRRALGLAEHPEAGAHREPPAAGRRNSRSRARRASPRTRHVARRARRPARRRALPAVADTAYVVHLLQRVREYGLRLSPLHAAIEEHLSAQHMTAEDAIRSEHQRQAAAQVSVANAITSLRLCSTLNWSEYFETVSLVEQVLQRDPAGVVRRDGFPEPRPPASGGRGARGADRRSAGARRSAGDRERAAGGGAGIDDRPRGPRRLSPRRRRPARSRGRRRLSARGSQARSARCSRCARDRLLSRVDRRHDGAARRRSACVYARVRAAAPADDALGRRCCCSCPPAKWRSRSSSGSSRCSSRRGGCCASISWAAFRRTRGRW